MFFLLWLFSFSSFLIVPARQQSSSRFGAPPSAGFGPGGGGVMPRARGPASVTISVKHGRAAHQGQLQTNSTPLILWCHAVDAQRLEPRRGVEPLAAVLPAQEIYFTHNGQMHFANMSQDTFNGTLIIEQPHIGHAGQWTCHIRTRDHGSVNGEITVYLRPVVFSNSSLRIDDIQGEKFRFEASGVTVLRGEDAQLECPVFGYPKPEIHWRKGLADVVMDERVRVENGTLLIVNATYEDEGTYICKAVNVFSKRSAADKRLQQSTVSIERRLRVKYEFGWLLPLCIILLTLALLIVIIVLCELRKRRKEQKQLLDNGNGDEE